MELNLKKIDDKGRGVIIDNKALKALYKHALELQSSGVAKDHVEGFLSLLGALDDAYEKAFPST